MWDFSDSLFKLSNIGLELSERVDRENKFLNFVYNSLVRQLHHNSSIERFSLSLSFQPLDIDLTIHYLIALVLQSGVKELDIMCTPFPYPLLFDPQDFFSATSLTVLRLRGSHYRFKLPMSSDTIIWPSLREIYLSLVDIDDTICQNLTFCCPFIEKFSLLNCTGDKNLELSGLAKLNEVEVENYCICFMTEEIQKVKIDLLSLRTFSYTGMVCMDVTTCKNIEVLKLRSPLLTDSEFEDLISNLPFLRILYLNAMNGDLLKRVKVSSQSLVKLKLIFTLGSVPLEAIIDTPNLHAFKYAASTTPSVFSVDTSRLVKATCQLYYTPIFEMNVSFFLKLRELVEYFKQVELFTLRLSVSHISGFPPHFGHIFIPSFPCTPKIKYLYMQLEGDSHGDQNSQAEQVNFLMDSLLKICHPESLLISLYGWDENNFVSTAMMHKEKRQCCCTASRINCWLLNIKGMHYEQNFAANGDRQDRICLTFDW